MSVLRIIEKLKNQDIHLTIEGDEIKVSGQKSKLTPHLLAEIRENKPEILKALHTQNSTLKSNAYKSYEYSDGTIVEFSEDEFNEIVDFFSYFVDAVEGQQRSAVD